MIRHLDVFGEQQDECNWCFVSLRMGVGWGGVGVGGPVEEFYELQSFDYSPRSDVISWVCERYNQRMDMA